MRPHSGARLWWGAVAVAALAGCGGSSSRSDSPVLTCRGSDTMAPLVHRWAESYAVYHPEVDIATAGGGSGTGIVSLLEETVDICAASRTMRQHERQLAENRGFVPREFLVARDGIAIVVHPEFPRDAVSFSDLKKIFTGAVTHGLCSHMPAAVPLHPPLTVAVPPVA